MYFPGDTINSNDSLLPGFGVFLTKGKLTAAIPGSLSLHSSRVSIAPLFPAECLRKGVRTMCKVVRIREDEVFVQILMINDSAISQKLNAVITRQHVRDRLVDQLVMHQCFIPGDIIKAEFLSFGDGRKVYLTTAKPELGVVYALSKAGRLMVRVSDEEMICMKTGLKEKRKCGWLDQYKQ